MKSLVKLLFACVVLASSAGGFAGNLEMRDSDGNYTYGKVKDNGKIEMRDSDGNYTYGKVKDNGKIEMRDSDGNYTYGRVR